MSVPGQGRLLLQGAPANCDACRPDFRDAPVEIGASTLQYDGLVGAKQQALTIS
jgi:hypothetical protein